MEGVMSKRVLLIPVDETPASVKLLIWTIENLYRGGDEIHLLHVIDDGIYFIGTTDFTVATHQFSTDESVIKRQEQAARDYMEANFTPLLDAAKAPFQHEIFRSGTDTASIGATICKRAEQLAAAVVVMAKHDKGTLEKIFIGSATKHCLDHCKQPLLVIHCDK